MKKKIEDIASNIEKKDDGIYYSKTISQISYPEDGNENCMQVDISIIIPLYKCESTIVELSNRITNVLEQNNLSFELILVNDNSPNKDWEVVKELTKNKKIKGINLSRNFGQHYAIFAGLEHQNGKWIVVMDGDLQDKPEEIIKLYNKAQQGYDIVFAKRVKRQDNWLKKKSSYFFYQVFGYLTDTKYDNSVANFGIYSHATITAVLSMNDKIKVFPILIQWVGFNKTSIEVEHLKRNIGSSSYSYKKLFALAFDIIMSYSNKPLKLTINIGLIISIISFLVGFSYLIKSLRGDILISGYASLIISIWFLSGVIIFFIGILGIYIGQLFDISKNRPIYIIKDKINL